MDEIGGGAEMLLQRREALLGGGKIAQLRLGDERAHPVDPLAALERAPDRLDHVVDARERHRAGVDRLAAGRLLAQLRDVHVAEVSQHQRARDRRRGQHQHVDRLALARKREALVHAEAVLLVDDRERQVMKLDFVLEQRMGADQQVEVAGNESCQDFAAFLAALAAGEDRKPQPGCRGERRHGLVVLAREDLGRRHQGGLTPAFDRGRGGKQRHHGLAGADIALQQAQHPLGLGEVGVDLLDRLGLRGCEQRIGKRSGDLRPQLSVATARASGEALLTGAHQRECELPGEQLVIGKPRQAGPSRQDTSVGSAG